MDETSGIFALSLTLIFEKLFGTATPNLPCHAQFWNEKIGGKTPTGLPWASKDSGKRRRGNQVTNLFCALSLKTRLHSTHRADGT